VKVRGHLKKSEDKTQRVYKKGAAQGMPGITTKRRFFCRPVARSKAQKSKRETVITEDPDPRIDMNATKYILDRASSRKKTAEEARPTK